MAKNKMLASVKDKVVLEFMDMFEYAYNQSLEPLSRMEEFQAMYDNKANALNWPTNSKIPIPLLFTMVERALPSAMNYLFPDSRFIRLVPTDEAVDMARVEKVERALAYTVRNRVRLEKASYNTLKDCFKLGVGYGIVEPITVTPPAAYLKQVFNEGEEVASTRILGLGNPTRTVRYRYITPGQVMVTPDGTDFNGRAAPTCSFFVDIYKENEFRALYEDQPTDGENMTLTGKVNDIVEEARTAGWNARVPVVDVVAKLGGFNLHQTKVSKDTIPPVVPVLKCYTPNRHVWIANGTTLIFDQKETAQTIRCPLIKASAYPDAQRWYPMSATEAAQKMAIGVNIWMNAMFDLLTHVVKPELVYDKGATGGKPPERGPGGSIGVAGDVRTAASYLETPPMPQGLFSVGDMLQQFYGSAVGQENFATQPTAGLVRGGANAFESMLQSTTGREQMAGAILESGFLQSSIEQILLFMQTEATGEGDTMRLRSWDKQTGQEYIEELKVTEDDLVHVFDVSLDLKMKHKNSAIDASQRQAEFSVLKDDPYVDQYELRRRFIEGEDEFQRLVVSRTRAQEIEEERRQAQLQAVQAEQQAAAPAQTPEGQGLAGAANIGGAL